jgi:hypothetical protein
MVFFDPILYLLDLKTFKKSLKRPSKAYFWLFLPTLGVFRNFCPFWKFSVFLLLNKASDERVGGPSFLYERGVAPLNSDPFRTVIQIVWVGHMVLGFRRFVRFQSTHLF